MAEAPDAALDKPYRLEEQIGFIMRLAGQRHAAIFQDMAPNDLTPTQFAALARLAEFGNCSQNELGRRTAMDVATIKGVVDRLRAKGFVTAASDPDDKRRSTLSLSPDFVPSVPALLKTGHAISEATLAPLSATERKTLLHLLGKISGS